MTSCGNIDSAAISFAMTISSLLNYKCDQENAGMKKDEKNDAGSHRRILQDIKNIRIPDQSFRHTVDQYCLLYLQKAVLKFISDKEIRINYIR